MEWRFIGVYKYEVEPNHGEKKNVIWREFFILCMNKWGVSIATQVYNKLARYQ